MRYSKYILGISAYYHDSAAVLLKDGEIISAVQEERLSRVKHDPSFPKRAIEYCLGELSIKDVDLVAYYEKPLLKFERILDTHLSNAPHGLRSFLDSMPAQLSHKIFVKEEIRKTGYRGDIIFPGHHRSHAASAYYPSPYEKAAILTIDGVGEYATTTLGMGEGNTIKTLKEIRFPHSIGLLYSAFTQYLGFEVNDGEYKLMGLAPYGKPVYADTILNQLIKVRSDASFELNMRYFDFCKASSMINQRFCNLFGEKIRVGEITQKHKDIARSIQYVTEEIMLKLARKAHEETGCENLCLAGGVALNCTSTGRILREGPFKNIWIQPASSDAGSALGAAYIGWHEHFKQEKRYVQTHGYSGPEYSDDFIERYLKNNGIPYTPMTTERVAHILKEQKIVGWYQGRMEFGPRALGARSILADPRSTTMKNTLNMKIKFRESFRPFAPAVMAEHATEYFEIDRESPHMLFTCKAKIKLPATTHVDGSARVQTVSEKDNPLFYKLIKSFYELTGCPVLINTSFNVRGEPIVCTPAEAYKCFMKTNMDVLVMGSFMVSK